MRLLVVALASCCAGLAVAGATFAEEAEGLLAEAKAQVHKVERTVHSTEERINQLTDQLAAESKKVDAVQTTVQSAKAHSSELSDRQIAEMHDVDKTALAAEAHINELSDRLTARSSQVLGGRSSAEHETRASGEEDNDLASAGMEIPWEVVYPCTVMTFLVYLYMFWTIFCPQSMGYRPLGLERRECALILAAVLYWTVLPISMVVLGYQATCEGGAPPLAYIVYGMLLVAHFACLFTAMSGRMRPELKDTPQLVLALVFCALEHFDMASDALFAGASASCSRDITGLWLESWQDARGGALVVPVLRKLGFSGLALATFVSSTYLPQLLCILAVIAPFAALVFMLLIVQWVAFGWIAGLVGIALTYALAVCTPLGREQASFIDDWATERNETLAMYIGAELVPAKGSKDSEGRPMMIAGTKLVLENMLQLMLQTSYLSLSFDRMDDTARIQALASLFVGIAVSALKGGQIVAVVGPVFAGWASSACRECNLSLLLCMAVATAVMFLGFAGLAWVAAKVVFIFYCDSHVWDLSAGCVSSVA